MCVATANVRTLLPQQEDRSYGKVAGVLLFSKVELLERQFADAYIDVIGVQEGRARSSHERTGHAYKMLVAAADPNGSYGVQLWLKIGISVRLWRVVSARIMYAIVCKKGCETGFLVGHAPHELSSQQEKDDWWNEFDATMAFLNKKYFVEWTVLIDANGRTGSIQSVAVGPDMPERENNNGSRLRVFAVAHGFILANTFGNGAGPTWTSTYGTRARIDYILLQHASFARMEWCKADSSLDLSLHLRDDHDPVVAVTTYVSRRSRMAPCKFRVNKFNLSDPARVYRFQALMWEFPHVAEDVHIDDHLEQLNEYVRWAARLCFGEHRDQPRKKWISLQ
eukprot:4281514-Karenia_brevis.AAC.1